MHTWFTADTLMQTIRLHEIKKPARGAERGAHCSQNTQPQLKSSKPSFKLQLHHHGNGIHQHQEACDIPERRNRPFQTAMVKHRFYTKKEESTVLSLCCIIAKIHPKYVIQIQCAPFATHKTTGCMIK